MKLAHLLLAFCLLFGTSFKGKKELTVDDILEKHIEAMGGYDKLNSIKTCRYVYEGRIAKTESVTLIGEEYLSRLKIGKTEFLFFANQNMAMNCSDGESEIMEDEEAKGFVFELYTFKLLNAKERSWVFEIDQELTNRKIYVLNGVRKEDGYEMVFYIDKKTFLIKEMKLDGDASVIYLEHKNYHGVMYPSKLKLKRIPFTKMELTEIEFNKPYDNLKTKYYDRCSGFN
ncbi:MAG: hypothetical protein JXQ87_05125 [Bacteroidia bacterium]